jgi:cephalosporin-C deacetylase
MPNIDLPLEQLLQYEGRNPRPHDFDTFWDKSITEMQALGTSCELVPAPFQVPFAECFDLSFSGVGGAQVHAKYLRPKAASAPHPR